ncbi:MAG: DUF2508 family protein [Peptostreptococcaceae bacterium]
MRKKTISKENIEKEKILKDLERAFLDVTTAESFFQVVNDPELVDMAIFDLEAKKSRYTYLLKMAKEKRVKKTIEEALIESMVK